MEYIFYVISWKGSVFSSAKKLIYQMTKREASASVIHSNSRINMYKTKESIFSDFWRPTS